MPEYRRSQERCGIKSIPLEQGLRLEDLHGLVHIFFLVIKSIPLEQGLRLVDLMEVLPEYQLIKSIPLEQGLRQPDGVDVLAVRAGLSLFH